MLSKPLLSSDICGKGYALIALGFSLILGRLRPRPGLAGGAGALCVTLHSLWPAAGVDLTLLAIGRHALGGDLALRASAANVLTIFLAGRHVHPLLQLATRAYLLVTEAPMMPVAVAKMVAVSRIPR